MLVERHHRGVAHLKGLAASHGQMRQALDDITIGVLAQRGNRVATERCCDVRIDCHRANKRIVRRHASEMVQSEQLQYIRGMRIDERLPERRVVRIGGGEQRERLGLQGGVWREQCFDKDRYHFIDGGWAEGSGSSEAHSQIRVAPHNTG